MNHLNAYTVRPNENGDFWTRIGAAFPNKNGGFTVLLDAMPATRENSYRIVLQPPKLKETAQSDLFDEPGFPFDPQRVAASRARPVRTKR